MTRPLLAGWLDCSLREYKNCAIERHLWPPVRASGATSRVRAANDRAQRFRAHLIIVSRPAIVFRRSPRANDEEQDKTNRQMSFVELRVDDRPADDRAALVFCSRAHDFQRSGTIDLTQPIISLELLLCHFSTSACITSGARALREQMTRQLGSLVCSRDAQRRTLWTRTMRAPLFTNHLRNREVAS